jgi:hypothetical protein
MAVEDFAAEHRAVLDEAMKIYVSKSQVRGQLWKTMPPSDKIRELGERVERLKEAYLRREEVLPVVQGSEFPQAALDHVLIEDSLDIINFSVFLIRQIREGARG